MNYAEQASGSNSGSNNLPCASKPIKGNASRRTFGMTSGRSDLFKCIAFLLVLVTLCISSCSDPDRVIDDNKPIANQNWGYGNKIRFDVQIDDPSVAYNLYINMRVTANYRYSNMFVLITQSGGSMKKADLARYELKLASPTGEWLGQGSGSMYSYQIPFHKNYRFPAKGRYRFEIEQNMRDNPLRAVSNVGLRVEKSR
ncbi:gliding motility lipoprotein GldH [Mucilaginibacter daejeonensis]|uniref:gliding motility lipoprotein GldH n=1 Tax=Mucilaginibacter daejeonensis TaxID=398049 RepID=UPI001D17ADF8|nr:gliding motility lipoprotein GldH [Mucilaginibacter daejeonensis]UEG53181.1 gliding motility lipoprotein GldH [Mucilaginibacter daejeonensis]